MVCLFSSEMDIARTILSMIGRFCISGSFGIVYVFSAELFPTVLRNTGIGAGSMHARVGGLIAPFVTELVSIVCSLSKFKYSLLLDI